MHKQNPLASSSSSFVFFLFIGSLFSTARISSNVFSRVFFFFVAAFHAKCDNQGPGFLIARTKGGAYFGAFNPLGWASREDYRDAFNAFLVKWPKQGSTDGDPYILEKVGGPGAVGTYSMIVSWYYTVCVLGRRSVV